MLAPNRLSLMFLFGLFICFSNLYSQNSDQPNFVIIFIDDMGYGDIEPFGSTKNKTPHLTQMAKEGMKLTDFYVSWTACSPSRASLLTGCYAQRVGFDGKVVFPGDKRGLNPKETTIASMLKKAGYKTGCFGKWHLGDQKKFYPVNYGFDEYYGIPYSNDMWPLGRASLKYPPLPILHNGKVVQEVPGEKEQAELCRQFTEEAIKFIRHNKDNPFFVYLPHAFVHGPRYAREEFMKRAEGDATRAHVEEVDWSTGEILKTLKELNIDKNTFVLFTSDNGPAGGLSAGPLRGAKGGPVYEGHMRVPTIAWWPETIKAGSVCSEIGETIDLLPTLAKLASTQAPSSDIIDGKNIAELFTNPNAKSPHKVRYYKNDGIREGKWKLLKVKNWELYDLENDLAEKNNLIDQYPDVATRLQGLLEKHNNYLATTARPAAFVDQPKVIVPRPGVEGIAAWAPVDLSKRNVKKKKK